MIKLSLEGDGISFQKEVSHSEAAEIYKTYGRPEPNEEGVAEKFWNDLTDKQRHYLKTIADEPKLNREVREILNLPKPQSVAGIRQGLTRKGRKHFDEKVDVNTWSEDNHENQYSLKENYRRILRRFLTEPA